MCKLMTVIARVSKLITQSRLHRHCEDMSRVTFGNTSFFNYSTTPVQKSLPQTDESICVLWDTRDEVQIFGASITEWIPCIVICAPDVLEHGELEQEVASVHKIFYPSDSLKAIYGKHRGMIIHQDLEKLNWCLYPATDEWEYKTRCEMPRR